MHTHVSNVSDLTFGKRYLQVHSLRRLYSIALFAKARHWRKELAKHRQWRVMILKLAIWSASCRYAHIKYPRRQSINYLPSRTGIRLRDSSPQTLEEGDQAKMQTAP